MPNDLALQTWFKDKTGLISLPEDAPQRVSPSFYGLDDRKYAHVVVHYIQGHTHLTAITHDGGSVSLSFAKRQDGDVVHSFVEGLEQANGEFLIDEEPIETVVSLEERIAGYRNAKRNFGKVALAVVFLSAIAAAILLNRSFDIIWNERLGLVTGQIQTLLFFLCIFCLSVCFWVTYRVIKRLSEL